MAFAGEISMALPEMKEAQTKPTKMSLRECFRCSALSALGGWLAVTNVVFPLMADPPMYKSFSDYALVCVLSGIFIVAGCALILLPALLILPVRSVLLRWPVTTANGAFAGSILYCAYYLLDRAPSVDGLAFCFRVGAVGGAVTGFIAALLVRRVAARLPAGRE
jgi:hypothetical protein